MGEMEWLLTRQQFVRASTFSVRTNAVGSDTLSRCLMNLFFCNVHVGRHDLARLTKEYVSGDRGDLEVQL